MTSGALGHRSLAYHGLLFATTLLLALAGTASWGSGKAGAQAWLQDRARAEGPGFRLGRLELHPGIGAEAGYDSNVFLSDQNEVGSAILRITPHLDLATLGPQRTDDLVEGDEQPVLPKVEFRTGVSASLYYFFDDAPQSNVGVDANMRLTIMPERPVSFTIFDTYSRNIRPFTEEGGGNDFARNQNDVGGMFTFSSRGGVLTARAGYTLRADLFESNSFDYANSLTHRGETGITWRFLPQTALIHDTRVDYTDYTSSAPSSLLLGDNTRLRSRVGVNGALTKKISFLAAAGYGAVFISDDAFRETDTVVAQGELRVRFRPDLRWALGYDRDIAGSFVGSFFVRDRGYTNLNLLLGGAFLLGVEGSVSYLDFGSALEPDGTALGVGDTTERTDIVVRASLFAEYRFTDWLAINGTFGYTADFTDFEFTRVAATTTFPDPADFQKFEAWFGVRAFY